MPKSSKSFKREVAVALLLWLVYVVEVHDVNLVEALVWPIFGFAAAAFGLDAYSKQLHRTDAKLRGTQHSSRGTEQPDSWHVNRNYYEGGEDK